MNIMKQRVETINAAMSMREAELIKEHGEDVVTLAKGGISALISTIAVNTVYREKSTLEFGKTMCVVFELLKTLDNAADMAADFVHKKN
jgi:hypothetical protein